jgi:hypothetical protein
MIEAVLNALAFLVSLKSNLSILIYTSKVKKHRYVSGEHLYGT